MHIRGGRLIEPAPHTSHAVRPRPAASALCRHARGGGAGNGRRVAAWGPLLLLAVLLALGGCLQEADDKCFTFDNTADPANDPSVCTTGEGTDTGGSGGILTIAHVSTQGEVVVIVNTGLLDEDMTGWTLEDELSVLPADTFIFPAFVLLIGKFVRVHSDLGTDDADDLYWDGGIHWEAGDTAVLKDEVGSLIDSCADGESCWDTGI